MRNATPPASVADDYRVAREQGGSYRLERVTQPAPGPCARIVQVTDRAGALLGWKLKPLVVMQGSRSRVWPSVADAIAATKLMTPKQAKAAVACAEQTQQSPAS